MKHMVLLVYISFIVQILSGCKPDESENWTRYEYLNEARDYIYFKTGTWWVYKRIPGGELDTIEVLEDNLDTLILTGNSNKLNYERCSWYAISRLDNYSYNFKLLFPEPNFDLITSTSNLYSQYFIIKSRPGDFGGQTNVIMYPFTRNILNNGHDHETKMLDDLDTIIVQNIDYYDVKHFHISNDATFIYDDLGRRGGIVEYYWAPNVGIIKKKHMSKNISWELVESHILQ